uniref:Uncharacterized protein n=1 Tax=Arundo donax TaxID=35708 RepID=A0A0A9GSG3_ARUDO
MDKEPGTQLEMDIMRVGVVLCLRCPSCSCHLLGPDPCNICDE